MDERAHGLGREGDYAGSKLGMWLFLLTEVFLFVGPLILYGVYRYRFSSGFAAASSGLSLRIGVLNTAVLLTSSLSMALSIAAVKRGKSGFTLLFLLITITLGSLFLFNKYFEWSHEIASGVYPGGEALLERPKGEVLFFGLYFFLTGLHGLHVFAGVCLLSVMSYSTATGGVNQEDFVRLENAGLYWHLVDVVWVYLFPLFYLIR